MESNNQNYTIYLITHPTKMEGYVGCNRMPEMRLAHHLSGARAGHCQGRLFTEWLRSLTEEEQDSLQIIELERLPVSTGKTSAGMAEENWRLALLDTGYELMNSVRGGGGLQSDSERLEKSRQMLGRDPHQVYADLLELLGQGFTTGKIMEKLNISRSLLQNMLRGHHVVCHLPDERDTAACSVSF